MAVFVDKLLIALGIDPRGAEQGLDRVNNSVDRTDAKLDELKHKAGDVARSIAMQIAGPLLAAFSVGKMVQGYISDVAEVAEQTGAYNKKLEEERLKKAQLQRVTKEDIELYKRGREAFVKFQIAMSDFSAKLMRTLMPFIKDLLDKLNQFTDWISHNSNNIIRFLTILASTITLALIPAVAKFTAALLKNPLTWVALLVVALALAIDDLIVYLKGGRSEFDAFWKWLGLTKGDTETLTKAINWLKTSGVELLKTIGKLTAAFIGMRAVWGVISMVRKAWNALSLSILANPIILAIGLLIAAGWMLYKNWDGVCEGIAALLETVENAWQKAVDWTADLFQSIDDGAHALVTDAGDAWDGLVNRVSHAFGLMGNILSAFHDVASEKMAAAGDAIGGAFTSALNTVNGVWQGMKEGASALVDDIENAFSGLTGWFSSLWDKITGIFDRAIGGIKSGIMSVTDALGITDSKRDEQAAPTPTDPEFERQKQAIIARRKKPEQTQAVQADNVPAVKTGGAAERKPESREPALPVRTGVSAPAVKTEKITEKRTEVRERIVPLVLRAHQAGQQVQQILAGAGRAQGVKTPAVNSGAVSNVRNSTQKSTINNDNRRQEVNITVNGNADTKTVGQIKDGVTGVFAQGAASPVMG